MSMYRHKHEFRGEMVKGVVVALDEKIGLLSTSHLPRPLPSLLGLVNAECASLLRIMSHRPDPREKTQN